MVREMLTSGELKKKKNDTKQTLLSKIETAGCLERDYFVMRFCRSDIAQSSFL